MTDADIEKLLDRALSKHSERIVEKAAEIGARKALAAVGLHDERAAADVKDLREILGSMRTAKRVAGWIGSVVGPHALKVLTVILIVAALGWCGIKPRIEGMP